MSRAVTQTRLMSERAMEDDDEWPDDRPAREQGGDQTTRQERGVSWAVGVWADGASAGPKRANGLTPRWTIVGLRRDSGNVKYDPSLEDFASDFEHWSLLVLRVAMLQLERRPYDASSYEDALRAREDIDAISVRLGIDRRLEAARDVHAERHR
jgi:hypothetical protein